MKGVQKREKKKIQEWKRVSRPEPYRLHSISAQTKPVFSELKAKRTDSGDEGEIE